MKTKIYNLTGALKRIIIPTAVMLLIAGAVYAAPESKSTNLTPSPSINMVTDHANISGKLILSIALFLYLLSQKSNEKISVKRDELPSNSVRIK